MNAITRINEDPERVRSDRAVICKGSGIRLPNCAGAEFRLVVRNSYRRKDSIFISFYLLICLRTGKGIHGTCSIIQMRGKQPDI